jgi:hypothetical protein
LQNIFKTVILEKIKKLLLIFILDYEVYCFSFCALCWNFGFCSKLLFLLRAVHSVVVELIKQPKVLRVYYITDHCSKQLLNQDEYFSYFDSWNAVQVTSGAKLSAVKTDLLPATMGTKIFSTYRVTYKVTK